MTLYLKHSVTVSRKSWEDRLCCLGLGWWPQAEGRLNPPSWCYGECGPSVAYFSVIMLRDSGNSYISLIFCVGQNIGIFLKVAYLPNKTPLGVAVIPHPPFSLVISREEGSPGRPRGWSLFSLPNPKIPMEKSSLVSSLWLWWSLAWGKGSLELLWGSQGCGKTKKFTCVSQRVTFKTILPIEFSYQVLRVLDYYHIGGLFMSKFIFIVKLSF